jgi:hypothetical protein
LELTDHFQHENMNPWTGSMNSKNGKTVSIFQKWDHTRPEINYLLAGFTRYIINEKYLELKNAQGRRKRNLSNYTDDNNHINWIERLLKTPLVEYRKLYMADPNSLPC